LELVPEDISHWEARQIYLGKKPDRLPDSSYEKLRLWLDPAKLPENHTNSTEARGFQARIFELIQRERIVKEVENRYAVSPSAK